MSGLATKIQICLFMLRHEQLGSLNISLLLTGEIPTTYLGQL